MLEAVETYFSKGGRISFGVVSTSSVDDVQEVVILKPILSVKKGAVNPGAVGVPTMPSMDSSCNLDCRGCCRCCPFDRRCTP